MGQSSSNKEVFKVGALKLGLQQMFNNAEPGKLTTGIRLIVGGNLERLGLFNI